MKKTIIAVACIIAGCTTKAKANTADSVNTFRSVNLQEVVVCKQRADTQNQHSAARCERAEELYRLCQQAVDSRPAQRNGTGARAEEPAGRRKPYPERI